MFLLSVLSILFQFGLMYLDNNHDTSAGQEFGEIPEGEHSQLQSKPCLTALTSFKLNLNYILSFVDTCVVCGRGTCMRGTLSVLCAHLCGGTLLVLYAHVCEGETLHVLCAHLCVWGGGHYVCCVCMCVKGRHYVCCVYMCVKGGHYVCCVHMCVKGGHHVCRVHVCEGGTSRVSCACV